LRYFADGFFGVSPGGFFIGRRFFLGVLIVVGVGFTDAVWSAGRLAGGVAPPPTLLTEHITVHYALITQY